MTAFTTRPELTGTFGMVASTHWLASAAGMAVLEQGGNAFDAAVTAGLTLQVVEPHLNGPGGFDAWLLVLRDFGTVSLEDVLRFPIHYADRGFPLLPRIAETIGQVEA